MSKKIVEVKKEKIYIISNQEVTQCWEAIKENPVNPPIKSKILFILYAQAFSNGAMAMINKWKELMGPYHDQYRHYSGD